jgi:MFS family permease
MTVPAPLRVPAFRRLWLAGLVSDAGDWLLLVSLPIFVYRQTRSTLSTSFAFLVELAPPILLGPLAGYLADRVDRRRLLVAVTLVQAATLLPLLTVHERADLPILYAVIAVQATLFTVFEPAKNALLPTLVGTDQLVAANSLVGLNANLGRLAGGPIGGLLLAVSGLPAIVAIDAATFLVAALFIAGVHPPAVHGPAAEPAPHGGFRAVLAGRTVRRVLAVLALAGAAQGMFTVLFVVFVARDLHGGEAEIGLLRGVQAIGAIGAGVAFATVRRVPPPGRLAAGALLLFAALSFAVWNSPRLTTAPALYLVLFAVVGAPGVVAITALTTVLQRGTTDAQRGRAFAAVGAAYQGSTGVGMIVAGLLGDRVGVLALLDAQATLWLLAGVLAAALLAVVGQRAGGPARCVRTGRARRRIVTGRPVPQHANAGQNGPP